MDTMSAADKLLILIGRDDFGDFNAVGKLMDEINRQDIKDGNDFFALEESKKYRRKMQERLDQQKQRQNQ